MQFNPDVPDVPAQSYLNYSKPIEEPKADESGKYRAQGIAIALDEGASIAKNYFEEGVVKPAVKESSGAIQEQFTHTLEDLNTLQGNNQADANLPVQLQQGLDKMSTLRDALAARKMNEVDYLGKQNANLKALRSQFPGFVDVIDKTQAEVTGISHTANAYLKATLEAINQNSTKLNAANEKIETIVATNAEKGIDVTGFAKQYAKDGDRMRFMSNVASANAIKAGDEALARNFELQDKYNKVVAIPAAQQFMNGHVLNELSLSFNNILYHSGNGPDQNLVQTLQDIVDKKRPDMTQEEMGTMAAQLNNFGNNFKIAQDKFFQEHPDKNGKRVWDIIGRDEYNKQIAALTTPIDNFRNTITSKDGYGLALAQARHIQSLKESGIIGLADAADSNVALVARQQMIWNDIAGPNRPYVALDQFSRKVQSGFDGFFRNRLMELQTRTNIDPTKTAPPTIQDAIQKAKDLGVKDPAVYEGWFGAIKLISDPKTDPKMRDNMIQTYYGPGNEELLNDKNFKTDTWDPSTRSWTKGKNYIYGQLYGNKTTDAIKASGDRSAFKMYRENAENNFANYILSDELQRLKDLQLSDGVRIGWDTDRAQIKLTDAEGADLLTPGRSRLARAIPLGNMIRDPLKRLNASLVDLAYIEKQDGLHPGVAMLNFLQANGIQITKDDSGVPNGIASAIMHSKKPETPSADDIKDKTLKTMKDLPDAVFKRAVPAVIDRLRTGEGFNINNYGEPDKNPSLSQWLKAPGGGDNIKVDDIPPGMDPKEFIHLLKDKEKKDALDQAKR